MLNGKTALVTGASSGIGRAIARGLAARGARVVLVARDQAALEALALPQAIVIVKDLSLPGAGEEVAAEVARRGLSIDFLVNNAGFGVHGGFDQTPLDKELAMVRLQIDAALALTKAVLPGMKARRQGWLLNVASVYSFAPVPDQAVYAACKAFLYSFSEALWNETRGLGINVSVCAPGTTKTAFRIRAGARDKGRGHSPEEVAEIAIAGALAGRLVTIPGFWVKLFAFGMKILPLPLRGLLIRTINHIRLAKDKKHA